jgi:hypothetical protein
MEAGSSTVQLARICFFLLLLSDPAALTASSKILPSYQNTCRHYFFLTTLIIHLI